MFNWKDVENARFMHKHIAVAGHNQSLKDMIDLGTSVFQARVLAGKSGRGQRVKDAKKSYGGGFTKHHANTLIVLTPISMEQLRAAFIDRNCAHGQYELKTGVFFMSYDGRTEIGLTAKIGVKFLSAPSGNRYLDHLNTPSEPNPTLIDTKVADMAEKAFLAQRIVSHSSTPEAVRLAPAAPTANALLAAKAALRFVKPSEMHHSTSMPTWALSELSGVDVSFLDD
jgi:hypothetical protein